MLRVSLGGSEATDGQGNDDEGLEELHCDREGGFVGCLFCFEEEKVGCGLERKKETCEGGSMGPIYGFSARPQQALGLLRSPTTCLIMMAGISPHPEACWESWPGGFGWKCGEQEC